MNSKLKFWKANQVKEKKKKMLSKLPVTHLKASPAAPNSGFSSRGEFCRFGYCARSSADHHKSRFKFVGQSLGDRWKLNDINTSGLLFFFSFYLQIFYILKCCCILSSLVSPKWSIFPVFLKKHLLKPIVKQKNRKSPLLVWLNSSKWEGKEETVKNIMPWNFMPKIHKCDISIF